MLVTFLMRLAMTICLVLVATVDSRGHVNPVHRTIVMCDCCIVVRVQGSLGPAMQDMYACTEAWQRCFASCKRYVRCYRVVGNNDDNGKREYWAEWIEECGEIRVTQKVCVFDERSARLTLNRVCGSKAPAASQVLCHIDAGACEARCAGSGVADGCQYETRTEVHQPSVDIITEL